MLADEILFVSNNRQRFGKCFRLCYSQAMSAGPGNAQLLMDWSWWANVAQVLGPLAIVVGVAQIIWSAWTGREAGARQAHRDYLQMCFENPDFSSTEQFLREHSDERLPALLEERTHAAVKYLWFLSIMLNSVEQITTFVSARGEWRKVAVDQVGYHHGAMAEIWLVWRGHYGSALVDIVEEALIGDPDPAPKHVRVEQEDMSVQARSLIKELAAWRSCSPLQRAWRRLRGDTIERRLQGQTKEG